MPYAVVLYFAKPFENAIRQVWHRLDIAGVVSDTHQREIRPHLTLGIYDEIDCLKCESEIDKIVSTSNISHIWMDHIGIFTNPSIVVFLAPPPIAELLAFHAAIHDLLTKYTHGSWKMYESGHWVPHCTLVNDLDKKNLEKAIRICTEITLPLSTEIKQIGMVEFDPIRPVFQLNF